MKEKEVQFKCDKCGKLQSENKEKSNQNWAVFDCNKKCECGGTFKMFIGGVPIG